MKERIVRYMEDKQQRTTAFSAVSLVINALIGLGKVILGVSLFSIWFMVNGAYYLLLCAARAQAVRQYAALRRVEDPRERYAREFAVYKRSGIFLCLLGVSYLLICLRMYLVGDSTVYSGWVVYAVATVSFVKLGMAIYGTVKNRHLRNPIMSTLKIISFIDAMVSIVVTQCTLLTMQGSAAAIHSSAVLGMAFSALFVIIGVRMLCTKRRETENGDVG